MQNTIHYNRLLNHFDKGSFKEMDIIIVNSYEYYNFYFIMVYFMGLNYSLNLTMDHLLR
jgi:hypothetical protein